MPSKAGQSGDLKTAGLAFGLTCANISLAMVKIFPFRGVFYNKKKIKHLSKVISPPYDIISPEFQEELYASNDFNYIRIILGKEFPGDSEYNNRYVRAAAFLNGWLRHKIMLTDDKPAIYLYEQKFSVQGKKYARLGFIGPLAIDAGDQRRPRFDIRVLFR
jgi:uncharacterized protein (DUF1015 family)